MSTMTLEGLLATLEARDLIAEAAFVRAHLAQPAQAVDVGAAWRDAAAACTGRTSRTFRYICEEAEQRIRALSGEKAGPVGGCAVNERCQKVMRDRGKPYPRTCYVCGLWGPCVTSDAQLASLPASPTPDKEGEGYQRACALAAELRDRAEKAEALLRELTEPNAGLFPDLVSRITAHLGAEHE